MESEKISEKIRTFVRLRPSQGRPEDLASSEDFYLTAGGSQEEGSLSIHEYERNGRCVYYSNTLKRDYQFQFDGFFDENVTQAEVSHSPISPSY